MTDAPGREPAGLAAVADAVVERARASQELIDQIWDFEDAPGSEERFRSAAEASVGSDMAGQLFVDVLFTQVARALGLQGRHDEGLAVLEDLGESADDELSVREQLERGRILNSSGKPDEARLLFEAAFDAASGAGFEHLAVDALHMVAIVAGADEQPDLHEQALDLAATASDLRARQWRASLLNNLGWTRFERGEFETALTAFEEALLERLKQGKLGEIAVARWSVGRTLRALERMNEALAVQLETAQEMAAAGISDPLVEEEIGECLRSLGREGEATPHFEAAASATPPG